MAVPIPVDIAIDPPPKNFTGHYLTDVLNLVAKSLHGTMDVSLLTGQIGGHAPSEDVGPWLNGTEWYYWNGTSAKYYPTTQGCPVGTVAIWGGGANIPDHWLLCEGQGVSATSYPQLFQAIGYQWGGSGDTFLLPPSGVFYVNAANFYTSPPTGPNQYGVINTRGGAQTAIIPTEAMPALQIQLLYLENEMLDENVNVPGTEGAGGSGYYYPVCDESGQIIGQNQSRIPIMPPFAAMNFIIKYL